MSELRSMSARLLQGLKKYRYLALVLLLGLVLLLLPPQGQAEAQPSQPEPAALSDEAYLQQMEQRLEQMLCRIQGAGQVRVMLSLAQGSNTHYQTDVQRSQDSDGQSSRSSLEEKTVIMSGGSAYDVAAVTTVSYPRFQGALVLCQGAGQAALRLQIISAVAALTGLSSDRISVVKMN